MELHESTPRNDIVRHFIAANEGCVTDAQWRYFADQLADLHASVQALMCLLNERVGNVRSGYYGSVKIDDQLIRAIEMVNSEIEK